MKRIIATSDTVRELFEPVIIEAEDYAAARGAIIRAAWQCKACLEAWETTDLPPEHDCPGGRTEQAIPVPDRSAEAKNRESWIMLAQSFAGAYRALERLALLGSCSTCGSTLLGCDVCGRCQYRKLALLVEVHSTIARMAALIVGDIAPRWKKLGMPRERDMAELVELAERLRTRLDDWLVSKRRDQGDEGGTGSAHP